MSIKVVEAIKIDNNHLETIDDIPDNEIEILVKITNFDNKTDNNYVIDKLCGSWQDDRTADEIINDIRINRTGFGNRKIEL